MSIIDDIISIINIEKRIIMGKFFAKHLSFIALAVWTLVMCTIFVWWYRAGPVWNVCITMGTISFIGTFILVRLLTLGVNTERSVDCLSWSVFISSLVMALTVYLTATEIEGIFIGSLYWWLFCSISCILLIDRCSRLNIELEDLRNSNTAEYIRKMVSVKRFLKENYEDKMLQLPDAVSLIAKYIEYSRFYRSVENKFIHDKRFAELWKEYFKHYSLLDSQEMQLFEHEDAKKIVDAYSAGSQLCERGELKLFSMPDAKEWVKMYIEHEAFGSTLAEKKLFEIPDFKELAEYYKSRYALYDDTYQLMQAEPQY